MCIVDTDGQEKVERTDALSGEHYRRICLSIKQHRQTVCVREPILFDITIFLIAYLLSKLWYYAKVAAALQRSHDVTTTILRYFGQGRDFRESANEREGCLDLTSKTRMVLFLTRCFRQKGKTIVHRQQNEPLSTDN